jgi:hypothetical protein
MAASGVIRWGAIGFMLGGVAWLVLGLSARFGYLQAIPGREDVVLYIVALLFTAAGLVGLHALQRASYGLFGEAFFYFTLVAIAGRILGAVVFLAGSTVLESTSWPATLSMLVGLVLYGVATLRAGVLPRWYGLVLILAMPVSLPLSVYGTALFGLFVVVLGYGLWLHGAAANGQPSRVR